MTIQYPRRGLKTRRHLLWQCAVSAAILPVPLAWRISNERIVVSLALCGLALAAMALSYQGLRYLALQEVQHPQPTPDMTFVFTLVATFPPAISTFLLILLFEM